MQCPYVKAPGDFSLKRKENPKKLGRTVKSEQPYYRRGHGTFRGGRECDRGRFAWGDAQALDAAAKQSSRAVAKDPEHSKN